MNLKDELERHGVSFRQNGKRFWACCPFHTEATASFVVSEYRGKWTYKCFGCGKSGDIIQFYRDKYGLTYPEALAKLGIAPDKKTKAQIRQQKQAEATEREYDNWKPAYHSGLVHIGELIADALKSLTPETLDEAEDALVMLGWVGQHRAVLESTDEDEKLRLFRHRRKSKAITDFAVRNFERRAYGPR